MEDNYFFLNDWRTEYGEHPQAEILKEHIERSIQDLFLGALRTQDETFIYIFSDSAKIDAFCDRMIAYWERAEFYEKCSEIVKLRESLKEKLATIKETPTDGSSLREWLNKSF